MPPKVHRADPPNAYNAGGRMDLERRSAVLAPISPLWPPHGVVLMALVFPWVARL